MKAPTISLPEPYEWCTTSHFGYFMSWEIRRRESTVERLWIIRETGQIMVRGNPEPREQLEAALRAANIEVETP